MSIILFIGNIGSGKTANAVREIQLNQRPVYTNIETKIKHANLIKGMSTNEKEPSIILKKHIKTVKKRDGSMENIYDFVMNVEFWKKNAIPGCDIYLDEIHNFYDSRNSGSRINRILNNFVALIRRINGNKKSIDGDIIFMTQLTRRADLILREMAHMVVYHIAHFIRYCRCGYFIPLTSEIPDPPKLCPECGNNNLKDGKFRIEVFKFSSVENFDQWKYTKIPSYFRHYFINDIEKYFNLYDTYQWKNLFEDCYM